jgi:hypothetical protein
VPKAEYPWNYAAGHISALLALFQPPRYLDFPDDDRRRFALEEPELAQTPLVLNTAARDAILAVAVKCHAILTTVHMSRVVGSVIVQLVGMLNSAILLGGQDSLGARVDWLVYTCMCFDQGRRVDIFTLYSRILNKRHPHLDLDPESMALVVRLINSFFLRLHHAVTADGMIEAARSSTDGIATTFLQMYTKLAQSCFRLGCTAAVDLKTCSACLRAKYCSTECQLADWAIHRQVCTFRAPVGSKYSHA